MLSTRRLTLATLVALCTAAGALALASAPALAVKTHTFLSSFGSFEAVQSVAVNQITGDVYVYDGGTGSIDKFNSTGEPSEFSALHTDAIEGLGGLGASENQIAVDSSSGPASGDIYFASGGLVYIFGADGSFLGGLTSAVQGEVPGAPWGKPCGVAVDSHGNVYVGLGGVPGRVSRYTPAANPVTNLDYNSSLIAVAVEPCNLAVDSTGDVYAVTATTGPITKYSALQFGSPVASGSHVDEFGSTLAVDPSNDDLFVDDGSELAQFASSTAPIGTFASRAPGAINGSFGVAVNGGSHDVYVAAGSGGPINVFGPTIDVPDVVGASVTNLLSSTATFTGSVNPDGNTVTSCEFEYGTEQSYGQTAPCVPQPLTGTQAVAVSADLSGLQPDTTYHYRLSAGDAAGTNYGKDQTFTTPNLPVVDATAAVSVGSTTAAVSSQINPNFATTAYHFEYGTTTAYGSSAPVPDAHISGATNTDATVTWTLTGLKPETSYHLRAVASNVVGLGAGADVTFTTGPLPGSESATICPNAALRTGQSANLPDCRAFEMVSAISKNGGGVSFNVGSAQGAVGGGGAVYMDKSGFGDTRASGPDGVVFYLASRGPTGWGSHALTPYSTPQDSRLTGGEFYSLFASDLSAGVLLDVNPVPGVPAPQNTSANYLHSFGSDALQSLAPTNVSAPPGSLGVYERIISGSGDLGHVLYDTIANLTPEATGSGPKLYEWDHGSVHLVSVLPNGAAAESEGSPAEDTASSTAFGLRMMSDDGSRAFFVSRGDDQLYMRKQALATTWISEPESSTPDPLPGPVEFQDATPSGKQVVFISKDQLTDGSSPAGEVAHGGNLYRYTDGPNPTGEANLQFIAREVGQVLGMSDDGASIYFVKGQDYGLGSIYLWRAGKLHLIGPSQPSYPAEAANNARVTPDGRELIYASSSEPRHITNAGGLQQIYLYDAEQESVRCVSCDPTGAITSGSATIFATGIPGVGFGFMAPLRALSSNDRYVFFTTAATLAPQDVNGSTDVYEYDIQTGRIHLISTGTSPDPSEFLDATPDGSEVFFATDQRLVGSDVDTLYDIYSAKVDGGFAEPPPALAPCSGDACQGPPPSAPSAPFPGSNTFSGPGNASPTSSTPVKKPAKNAKKPAKKRKKSAKKVKKPAKRKGKKASHKRPGNSHAATSTTAERHQVAR